MKTYFFYRDERWPDFQLADNEKWSDASLEMSDEDLSHMQETFKEYERLQMIIKLAYDKAQETKRAKQDFQLT